jgi:hypothetical protein
LTKFAFRKYFRLNDKTKQIAKPAPDREFGRPTRTAVRIGNATTGYLHHGTGLSCRVARERIDRAAYRAMIIARPDPQLGSQAFCVCLDAQVPFNLADRPTQQSAIRGEPTAAVIRAGSVSRYSNWRSKFEESNRDHWRSYLA